MLKEVLAKVDALKEKMMMKFDKLEEKMMMKFNKLEEKMMQFDQIEGLISSLTSQEERLGQNNRLKL